MPRRSQSWFQGEMGFDSGSRGPSSAPTAVDAKVLPKPEKTLRMEVASELQEESGECIPLLELTWWFNKQFKGKRNSFLLAVENLTLCC